MLTHKVNLAAMIKKIPSYNLKYVQNTFVDTESLVMSSKARRQLGHLGVSLDELVQIIQVLTTDNFVQSVCISSDYQLWKDIYIIQWGNINLFLNFQMTEADELMITLDRLVSRMV